MANNTGDAPLSPDEFDYYMGPFGPFAPGDTLAVAVSGGCDSMALVWLLNRWAKTRDIIVTAVTIDHGLRPESGDEARQVGLWLFHHAIPHHIISWNGTKGPGRLQERARAARYRLLYDFCWERNIAHLFLAHHQQDQWETIRMRQEKGSTYVGLCGMEPIRPFLFGRVLRPLLTVSKQRLRTTLIAASQNWIDDPSNLNPAFWRGAYRLAPGNNAPPISYDDAQKWAALRNGRRHQLRRLMTAVCHHPYGWGSMKWNDFQDMNSDDRLIVIPHLIRIYGTGFYPPARTSVLNLLRVLDQKQTGTLGHCLIVKRGPYLIFAREVNALPKRESLTTLLENSRFIWFDSRFWLEWPKNRHKDSVQNLAIGPLSGQDWPSFRLNHKDIAGNLPHRTGLTVPALYRDGELEKILLPHEKGEHECPPFRRCIFSGNQGYAVMAF